MRTLDESGRKLVAGSDLFDPHFYSSRNPDVALTGLDPLTHFLRIGVYADRDPSAVFHTAHYRSQCNSPAALAEPALVHYLREGWRQKLSPHPLFDTAWYLGMQPDIAEAGVEPLAHFLHTGAFEGRLPHPAFPVERVFDRCPWLRETRRNPLEYYLSREWAEDPCPEATAFLAGSRSGGGSSAGGAPIHAIPREKPVLDAPVSTDIRAIAIYLPQFHAIPENDEWWGRGFTEWANVRRATPQYAGHYQPHVPHPDLGYYDLNDASVLDQQADMARAAGIEGFCFYYYWFNGRRLLNMPTDRLLSTGRPDFPFCFCWANENWTRTWDGGDREILIGQEHSHESDERFILDLLPAFRDPRYIRVDGKPLLVVYRPALLPDPAATARHWRETCRREGIGEVFLAFLLGFESPEPASIGFDTAIQMPPLRCGVPVVNSQVDLLDPAGFAGEVRDYRLAASSLPFEAFGKNLWPAVCPSWDNTARRMERAHSWIHSSPGVYHEWLSTAVRRARGALPPGERFVFINAWNEWAEGCHLEPDEKHGYAWLNATRLALTAGVPKSETRPARRKRVLVVGHDAARAGAQIVLLTMLAEWKASAACDFRLVLLGDGVLRPDFEALCPTLVLSDHARETARIAALEAFCEQRPDVVLVNTVVCGPFLPHLKRLGAPIATYVHELQKSIERWAPGPVMSTTVENSDHFIAVSSPVAENLSCNHGIPPEKISTLHPYIKTRHHVSRNLMDSLRSELGVRVGEKIVFGCGTVDWRKGPDLFVEAALEVLKKIPTARFFWIGGDGGDEAAARARSLATDPRILFLGERKNPRDYFALGSAFLLSSREDPFPLVALEAADAGLPIVCFEGAGGIPGFVGNEHGRTVPFEDNQAAAAALVEFLSDGECRKSVGMAAQVAVRSRHNAAQGSAAVLLVLENLLLKPKNNGREHQHQPLNRAPLVSVIVPNYNHSKFLPERLATIAAQTHRDIEIILLDDKSTDNSLEILQAFVASDPRARLVENDKNSGSTFKQWRKGLSLASGKYVWIAESDDSAHPELLRTLVSRLESNSSAAIAACCPRMTDINGVDLGIPKDWFSDIGGVGWESDFSATGREVIESIMSQKNAILNASGVLFRNQTKVAELVDDSMRLCADWLFWVRLMAEGDLEYSASPMNYWRLASSNARNKPPGETEWEEGSRIYLEIAKLLGWTERELALQLEHFRKRCEKWKWQE
jgi:glycosyltransferase involved in cell wall biosynthesis